MIMEHAENAVEIEVEAKPPEMKVEKPVKILAGFWRRLFAFFIDTFILGTAGLIFGYMFYDFCAGLGAAGRIFGFVVSLLYFGLLNSRLGHGQTIGKRALKIKVTDRDKKEISVLKSFGRFAVFGIPYFLNGASFHLDPQKYFFFFAVIGIIVFFGTGSIIYLFIFNRRTRQSSHDLIAGTFVIKANSDQELRPRPVWKGHFAVLGLLFAAVIIVLVVVNSKVPSDSLAELKLPHQELIKSGLVHDVGVQMGQFSKKNDADNAEKNTLTAHYLTINAMLRKRPVDNDKIMAQLVSIVLEHDPQALEKDVIICQINYGFDLGIARLNIHTKNTLPPAEWKAFITETLSGGNPAQGASGQSPQIDSSPADSTTGRPRPPIPFTEEGPP